MRPNRSGTIQNVSEVLSLDPYSSQTDISSGMHWYALVALTKVDPADEEEVSAVTPPIDQATTSEFASGISTVVEDSPTLVEYEVDLSHLMETADDHAASAGANPEQSPTYAAPPSDLAGLLSQLSKGSNSPATQGGTNGTHHNGTPPPSTSAPIALDMNFLSKIVSSVNAAKATPSYNPHPTYAQPNLPIQSHYPQGSAHAFTGYQQHNMMSSVPPLPPQGNGWNRSAPPGYPQYNQQGSYSDVRPKKCYDMINKGQ